MSNRTLSAGDTYSARVRLAEYPASAGWTLKERFTPRVGGSAIETTGAADGDDHVLAVTASATANWAAGAFGWVRWVEKGAESYTVDSGQLVILPNLRTIAAGADTRSQAQKALDDAKVAYAAWSPTRRRYKIGEREMEFNSSAEIVRSILYWEAEVAREAGQPSPFAGRYYYRA